MSKKSGNGLSGVIAVCCIIAVVYLIDVSGQCSQFGCTNRKVDGRKYCYTHSHKSSTYSTSQKKTESDTSSSKTSESSTCSVSGCSNSRLSGSRYCKNHTCQKQGCNSLRNENGTIYCNLHAAAYVRQQGYRTCLKSECYRRKSSESAYCSEHTCKNKDCTNSVSEGSRYCSTHSQTSSSGSSTYKRKSSVNNSSSSISKKSSDPYNAQNYNDPEDFYYDYYDDFYEYDDAEEYWNENHE